MCVTFASLVSLWPLPLGDIPASEHYPLFLGRTQPHLHLLPFLSTSGTIFKNYKCVANKDWSGCSILPVFASIFCGLH